MTRRAKFGHVPTEKAEQRAIVQLLESIGAKVYSLSQPRATMQAEGLPDLLAFLPHPTPWLMRWAVWIEVKARGGKMRPGQDEFRRMCALSHTPHVVGGLDDVIAYLQRGGWVK